MSKTHNLYRNIADKVDIPFLLFLLTVSSNKIYLKVIALILIYVLKPRFNLVFNRNLTWFYPGLIILGILQFLLFGGDYSGTHFLVLLTGCFYWFLCYAFFYQSWMFAKENSDQKIGLTLKIFVLVNFVLCIWNYFAVSIKAGTILPFLQYEGDYGASTGDYICGLFGAPSYLNAIASCMFALYYVKRGETAWFLITAFSAFLSFANIFNIIFVFVLLVYLLFVEGSRRRLLAASGIVLCFLMYVTISPDNYNYLKKTVGLSVNNEREIMPQVIMKRQGDTARIGPTTVKYRNDSAAADQRIEMIDRALLFNDDFEGYKTYDTVDITKDPGKKIAVLQTLGFFRDKPLMLVAGAGIGNFSSRLAFQYSGRDSSRLFMKLPKYAHGYYFKNHLLIYDSMRQLPLEYHSIKHFPNNFFSQLLGEYGLAGIALFFVFYLRYFYRNVADKRFFFMLLMFTSACLMLDYFYEFFNVMIIFELLLLIDSRTGEKFANKSE